jgi:threonylcarbamoyladenosine tRNA methylthiotransferase MtaB
LGCKVNQYESNQIAAKYKNDGYFIVTKFVPDADIYIVNTCAVTAHAEKKSRNLAARVRRTGREVIIMGCAKSFVKCDCDKAIPESPKALGSRSGATDVIDNGCITRHPLQPRKRAFIKVQDGCNNFCSYCIVPYLRGRSTSRPIPEVVEEMKAANKPTVITGIDLSSYGLDIGTNLAQLCIEIDKCGLPFELSSVEVRIITPEFLATLKNCKNFIPKFHLPLQSGSNKVLKDMNRKYTREQYLAAVEGIRKTFPDAILSTDVIIGYPTETPTDLAQTHEIITLAKFNKVHTFPYSDRSDAIKKVAIKRAE